MLFSSIGTKIAVLALLVVAHAFPPQSPEKHKVLVVFDDELVESPDFVSKKFGLHPEEFEVLALHYTNAEAKLFNGGKRLVDHLIFMPTSKKSPAATHITSKHSLLGFFNAGGNIIGVGSSTDFLPEGVTSFLNQVGIFPAPKGHRLASFFDPEVTLNDNSVLPNPIVRMIPDISYDGTAALISNSELVYPLVKAPKLSFCANPKHDILSLERTWTNGEQGFVSVAFQGLNSARGAWIGSIDLASKELSRWAFQRLGLLKLQYVKHHKISEPENTNRTLYRIKDDVHYEIGVSEFNGVSWFPYTPKYNDVFQLAFKMLDPYQRLNMTFVRTAPSGENTPVDMSIFSVDFRIPDHHGMFTFELDYKVEGYNFLEDKRIVAVRHLANDEYRRSFNITNAWVYIASSLIVVIAWFLFVVNFLYLGKTTKEESPKEEEKKEKKESLKEKKESLKEKKESLKEKKEKKDN